MARIDNQYIKEVKAKHKELDGGRTHWGGKRDAVDAMDKVLLGSTRIWDRQEYTISGQHKRGVIQKEQEETQHQKQKTYFRALLFHKGSVRNRGRGNQTFYTEEMWGEHFTKPLQGALLRKFRAEIMNIPDELDLGEMVMDRTGF